MPDMFSTQRLFSFPDFETPLGRVHFGGFLPRSTGTGLQGFRHYGMYAAVLILNGSGIYRDANRKELELSAGSAILVFPDLAHHYGPKQGERWDEIFVAFSGSAFDAWRAHGLDRAHPVWQLRDPSTESGKLHRLIESRVSGFGDALGLAAAVHRLLADWLSQKEDARAIPAWLEKAARALASPHDRRSLSEIARESGFHIDAFRRAFRLAKGEPPGFFRRRHRLSLAVDLLRRPDLSLAQIAETLGFHDAFHFSKQFKAYYSIAPSAYRDRPPAPSGKIIRPC